MEATVFCEGLASVACALGLSSKGVERLWKGLLVARPIVHNGSQLCLVADFETLNYQNTQNYEQRAKLK